MTAVVAANMTLLDAGTGKALKTEAGKAYVWTDTYEAASLVAGSTIAICDLPIDSSVIGVKLYIDALGASSTLIVGDVADPDRYLKAISSATAGLLEGKAVDGIGFVNTSKTRLYITTAGATISGTIKAVITYLA
jgi:hypothetical protein